MKDTKKKLITTGLAVVRAMTTVGGVACAAEPVDTAAREADSVTLPAVQPRTSLFPEQAVSGTNTWVSPMFTATAANGNYIRYWYRNDTNNTVIVYLHRTDSGNDAVVSQMTISGAGQAKKVYRNYNSGSGTYYLLVDTIGGGAVSGRIAAAQYLSNPTN